MNGHKYPRAWEFIKNNEDWKRLKVPGGWLVHHTETHLVGNYVAVSECCTFFPDPDGDWVLEPE